MSMAVDVLLLAAGLTLWTLLELNPAHEHRPGAKLLLYGVLGSLALKRARTRRHEAQLFMLAIAQFGFIVTIALKSNPASLLAS